MSIAAVEAERVRSWQKEKEAAGYVCPGCFFF
jgi:hypothetical protein